jgi:stringent starvation protein B
MISSRPYLLRAFHEWILDNQWTPYLVIRVEEYPDVVVPMQYVEEGRIILDLSSHAIRHLVIANTHIVFNARFAGKPFEIFAPMAAVAAIYSKENGRGMVFKPEDWEEGEEGSNSSYVSARGKCAKKGSLRNFRLIKGEAEKENEKSED